MPVTAVRFQGIIHDFVMLNALAPDAGRAVAPWRSRSPPCDQARLHGEDCLHRAVRLPSARVS